MKHKTKSKLTPLTVRLSGRTLGRLRDLAHKNHRSVAWMINEAVGFTLRNNKLPEWR
ncbi:MAG: hypothetical protein KGJ13_10585 [Patescibacteria group bacterium]|nr:hypothetical protein [Patescibacteria group bacterium]